MQKLIEGVHRFHAQMRRGGRSLYETLADGQAPDTFFVTCADSRLVPAVLAASEPGDLFTMRNVGNLIPPADRLGESLGDRSEASAIEFALEKLHVSDVVLCGHSACGAMAALLGADAALPVNLARWLELARPALDATSFPAGLGEGLPAGDVLSQRNVLLQLRALRTYPTVDAAVASSRLRLHGWWFDIATARVAVYAPEAERFVDFERAYPENAP